MPITPTPPIDEDGCISLQMNAMVFLSIILFDAHVRSGNSPVYPLGGIDIAFHLPGEYGYHGLYFLVEENPNSLSVEDFAKVFYKQNTYVDTVPTTFLSSYEYLQVAGIPSLKAEVPSNLDSVCLVYSERGIELSW